MSALVAAPSALKRRIVLLGPPASGKGTQAELLHGKYGFPITSPGAILREEKRLGTPLGVEADRLTGAGRLLPDEMVVHLVAEWIAAHHEEFVFDGFPRSVGQAEALEGLLRPFGAAVEVAVALEADEEKLRERVAARLVCLSCGQIVGLGLHVASPAETCPRCGGTLGRRADDTPEILVERLREYHRVTAPLLAYYGQRGVLRPIDSTRTPQEVFAAVCAALENP